jgi:hypothetical protein
MRTPAIYVFKYKKMFYGTYQRWQFIESKSDFDLIDDDDIYKQMAITDFERNEK